ncbi:MAG TPA: hypothetical protein VK157_02560 [Phycisphaerales bacterium]|nr:hypothetical protein [Phycisphaerales bacterium]
MSTEILYAVIATLPDEPTRRRYVDWLLGGHIQQVCAGGATAASVIRLDGQPLRVMARYTFPTRDALERYIATDAPRLRAEGLALFGPETGVSFERLTGEVAGDHP